MPIKEIKVNLPQGTYETIVFDCDGGLSEIGKITQIIGDMEYWSDTVPRCNWWLTQLKRLLAKRVEERNGS